MLLRPKTVSRFRPVATPDHTILAEHRTVVRDINRRGILKGSLALGALPLLTGCNVSDRDAVQSVLRSVSAFNDAVQAWLFDPTKLARTYDASLVVRPPRFNAYYEIEDVRPIDISTWKLELSGLIAEKASWTIDQLYALPEQEIIIKHICVEGWDYIGQWSGPNLRQFLTRVGADLRAKYVVFHGNDDYMESIDMASALHAQTILATKYAGEPIGDPYGYPIRLRTAVKLGYKNPKWLRAIEVTNTYSGGFWEDQGFNWFAGM
ncbi:MAG: molybdopterin-dependent oxidoreductase [Pseudomonadota bacterium]